ncbi:MAG: aminomethyl-transferring glycine dehydrogenase subunit GcvPA [Alphaproteobacteria bacterium]|nr:aminomethyl-transferring glycine dehydrogenase subunit GcvPA [Alphaproteobacteria bacterium]
MANSVADIKQAMLDDIGAKEIEELFEQIPEDHRLKDELRLPKALRSEAELKRHLLDLLSKTGSCEENLSFLGAGCWQHHVPAVCDEITGRAEFLTNVWGSPSSDHGRNQAWFEYCSQIGELVQMDMVGLPVYSYGCAAGHAIRMASRITGRHRVLVPGLSDPERLSVIRNYCEPEEMASHIAVVPIDYDVATGLLDLDDLRAKISDETAAVYFENPSYAGVIERQGAAIAEIARASGAETIVGVDPISLGVIKAPADYGADIVVGTTQPLGVHMNTGGGVGGFIASRDEEKYVREYNTLNISITETEKDGQYGFGLSCAHQTSYGMREKGKDWTGNSTYLWAIAGAVYMSLLGPDGFREVGRLILQRAHYAAAVLARVPGLRIGFPSGFFKEFVVRFDDTGRTVDEVNGRLRERGIFGGKDLSAEFPELGQCALYCITEIHTKGDIDRLANELREVLR